MSEIFGRLANGETAHLYTIHSGAMKAVVSNLGATLIKLFVPDREGMLSDVVLGFDKPQDYVESGTFFGATVGRNCNRIGGAQYTLNGKTYALGVNDNEKNNLHSGPDFFKDRIWEVAEQRENAIVFALKSPHMDQGFPGNAEIRVTYSLETGNTLRICTEAVSDRDTVFNFTNHSYFNLAGHEKPEKAMEQVLTIPGRFYTVSDGAYITTGEKRSVAGTAMDFRVPKPIGRDIDSDEEPTRLQCGYDHNFEVFTNPCAILEEKTSGRSMAVFTDRPGVQLYSGNFMQDEKGKDGVTYPRRGGVCLETQYYPNAINYPHWPQPVTKAGEKYKTETAFIFSFLPG
ncbi:MAG: galactose mutarotase [Ruminococcaceae bacterium]|nr:galactose mutarotase [Oscillospiraceae bacterium]